MSQAVPQFNGKIEADARFFYATVESAARLLAQQPGGPEKVLAAHYRRDSGDCAGCGTYRPTRWPCVLILIGRRAVVARRPQSRERPG